MWVIILITFCCQIVMEVLLGRSCAWNVRGLSVGEDTVPSEPCVEGIDEKISCVAGGSRNTEWSTAREQTYIVRQQEIIPFVLVSFMVAKIWLVLFIKYVPRGMCWVTENRVEFLNLSELGLVVFQARGGMGCYFSFL